MLKKFFKTASLLISSLILFNQAAHAQDVVGSSGEQVQTGDHRSVDPGAVMELTDGGTAIINGRERSVSIATKQYTGYFIPDGNGGMIFKRGKEVKEPNPRFIDAREIKLKVRELADQLTEKLPSALRSSTFLPTTFVNQDNFDSTSSFGRYIAEQLYFEFNQRGMHVQEYRLGKNIKMNEGIGETVLTRGLKAKSIASSNQILAVGTYYATGDAVMLNARLVQGSSGTVLSSAQLIFKQTKLSKSMIANRSVKAGGVRIKAFPKPKAPGEGASPFDLGQDIH